MDHMRFKANLTAATYVSHGLDEGAQEAFELHLMSCPECLDDVEAWRAIEKHLPRDARESAPRTPSVPTAPAASARPPLKYWRLAASLIGIGLLGAAAGWYGRAFTDPELARTAFFNAAPLTRGAAECMPLKLAPDTERIVLRIAGVASERRVVAVSPSGEASAAASRSARHQADGSWLLQFTAATLARGAIRLESEGDAGSPAEPLGCVSAQLAP
jgi:hypothetical protein